MNLSSAHSCSKPITANEACRLLMPAITRFGYAVEGVRKLDVSTPSTPVWRRQAKTLDNHGGHRHNDHIDHYGLG